MTLLREAAAGSSTATWVVACDIARFGESGGHPASGRTQWTMAGGIIPAGIRGGPPDIVVYGLIRSRDLAATSSFRNRSLPLAPAAV